MPDRPAGRLPTSDGPSRPRRPGTSGRRARRFALMVVATSSLAPLAACGGSGADPDAASAPAGTAAVRAGTRGADRSAAWPGGAEDRDVVARRTVAVRRAPDARTSTRPRADLLIRGLTVRGRVATLRFTAVLHDWDYEEPRTDGGSPPSAPALYDINPGRNTDTVSAQLIDPVHLRRHLPLQDSEGEELADMNFAGQSGEGQAMDASWMFAAPPEGVDAMDVQVGSWPVFREVPVTRR
ncbi:hypothetical protein [Patulibacter minatonensis]|uniref:hypothetical protein n=1 Tax=Patulibacter minatonensis TaxID=298163 RepID=UPI0004788075|nr:hypothetical protein [Patulibacter minatonensis]